MSETDELPDSPFESIDSESDGIDGEESLSSGTPMERLLDGDAPGPQVGELRADYDMPQWMAVLSRGIMRVATGSGVPPIAEIIIGTVMGIVGSDMSLTGEQTDESDGSTADGTPPGYTGE